MIKSKRGEEMVEAAMILPILVLIIFSMILFMLYQYQCHQNQIALHHDLIQTLDESDVVFDIEVMENQTIAHIAGAVDLNVEKNQKERIYLFSAAECIRIGEMLSFDEE